MKKELNEVEQMNYDTFFANVAKLRLSSSALKLLLDNPKLYYNDYVLGNKEVVKAKHFDEGSLVHCLVLEPENINDNFVVMSVATPSDSIKNCLDNLMTLGKDASELEEYYEEIIAYLKEINLYQSLVDDKKPNKIGDMFTGDEKRIAKVITENSIEYFQLMIEGREKIIVDLKSWDKCLAKAHAVKDSPEANFLLTGEEIRFELLLEDAESNPDIKYGIKGILDAIKIDRENKTIYISDLKTTNGKLSDFAKNVETYSYWLQAAIYKALVKQFKTGIAYDYKVVFNFIVVDRDDNVYCFKVSDESMIDWEVRMKELINTQVSYHIENKDFVLPYSFANNLITL